jgi:hypothetical protein
MNLTANLPDSIHAGHAESLSSLLTYQTNLNDALIGHRTSKDKHQLEPFQLAEKEIGFNFGVFIAI